MNKLAKGLFFDEETVYKIHKKMYDPKYRHLMIAMRDTADKIVDHKQLVFDGDTFTFWYFARNRAMDLAMITLMTQEAQYINAVKEYIDYLDCQELNFWQGPEYPNRPRTINYHGEALFAGELETAQLTMGLVAVYDWCYGVLDETYRGKIRKMLKDYAYPLLKNSTMFQSEKWVMNHLCVISSALLMLLLVLEDEMVINEDLELAKHALGLWIEKTDADGSYGESYHYWAYPMNCIFLAIWSLDQVKGQKLEKVNWLSRAFEWAVYNQVGQYKEPDYDKKVSIAVNAYDCPYQFQMEAPETLLFANYFKNPLAKWYMDHYLMVDLAKPKESLHYVWHECNSLLFALYDDSLKSVSPEEYGLPKCRVFHDTGFVFFRDEWAGLSGADQDIVLQMLSGGGGRSRSHEHIDKNSISLYAKGEYFLVDPGHSCYRGEIHEDYDRRTSSHNTINLDDKDQTLRFAEKGMLHDEAVQYVSYNNQAQIVGKNINDDVCYIASDARKSYEPYVKEFTRHIWFVDNRYFVIRDRFDKGDHRGTITSGFNFNNRDGKLNLKIQDGLLFAERPKADLMMQIFVNERVNHTIEDGRLHTAYHILPNMGVEGKKGSVKRVKITANDKSAKCMDYIYVLVPLGKGEFKPIISGRALSVNDEGMNKFEDYELVIERARKRDQFLFVDEKVMFSNDYGVKYIF